MNRTAGHKRAQRNADGTERPVGEDEKLVAIFDGRLRFGTDTVART